MACGSLAAFGDDLHSRSGGRALLTSSLPPSVAAVQLWCGEGFTTPQQRPVLSRINLHIYCSRASLFTINVNADCTRSGNRFAFRGGASCTPRAAVYPNLSSKSPDTRPRLSSTTTSQCVFFHSAFSQKRGCSFQQALSCHGYTTSSAQRNKCQEDV